MSAYLPLKIETPQNYHAGGRVEWALDLARQGSESLRRGEYATAAAQLLESIESYPHPTTLRRLGICLLLDGKPAESVVHFAAAVGLSKQRRHLRPTLLLAKAFLVANDGSRCARLIKSVTVYFPQVVRNGIVDSLRRGWRRIDLHVMVDELLALIPERHDTADAKDDPPVSLGYLWKVYEQREADSKREFS
jgi:hypothetical protein